MTDQLLVLLVAAPLLASTLPLFVAVRSRRLARWLVLAVLVGQVALAVALAWLVSATGPVSSVVGAIPASFGIGLFADRVTAALALLVAAGALAASLTDDRHRSGPEYALWLLLVAGLSGVVVTADVFNLYVFLEISGLAAYALVASARGVEPALAALQYLLVGTVGATLYLLGVGYAFVATGTLSMADLSVALAAAGHDSTLVVAAFALMTVGLSVKLALFPLHAWKPDAYAAATPAVATVLAALGSTVAGYALVRIVYDVFTAAFFDAVPAMQTLLLAAAATSVVAGGVLALRTSDARRLLAYSSVSQYGLFGVGLAMATPTSVTGALVVLVGHAVAKGGLFVAAGDAARRHGATAVEDYAGLADRDPLTAAAVAVLGVSLVGLPPTVGFAGKWSLALGAIAAGSWVVATVVLASTLLALAYVGRLVERCYLGSADAVSPGGVRADGGVPASASVVVLVAAAALVVALGLGSSALAAWFAPVVEGWL
ncbi:proton-conducting transporter membrane subunit [Haloarcula onubensis]|uniref:Monovalent cation/H+ antiporter subunit D family protein n=1 Tax=Haloarcula onubensis TaxID=2950539 RepID=A0ABU2FPJ1_9EURY|nr:proton-conducting transporter membrane subunit [Halomicroarcula sp. S3CR25-11]MDS0282665.1 monovalent cation/H+ antiporter subunit D family protein [Halomicroarcula sp. S3CR25-11]